MKRCCLFFLLCLFSLQVFAGGLLGGNVASASETGVTFEAFHADLDSLHDEQKDVSQDDGDNSDNGLDPASAGDETIPTSIRVFVSNAVSLAPPLGSDPVIRPPFLPPPARPPRA